MNTEKFQSLRQDPELTKELLLIHLQKPNKVALFYEAFRKLTVGGTLRFEPTFSWYAFFFPVWYFLYRKLYIPALVILGISLISGAFSSMLISLVDLMDYGYYSSYDYYDPYDYYEDITDYLGNPGIWIIFFITIAISGLMTLAISIGSGISAKYFYIKKFIKDLDIAGFGTLPFEEVKNNLLRLGGFNHWVVVLFCIILGFGLLSLLIAIAVIAVILINVI